MTRDAAFLPLLRIAAVAAIVLLPWANDSGLAGLTGHAAYAKDGGDDGGDDGGENGGDDGGEDNGESHGRGGDDGDDDGHSGNSGRGSAHSGRGSRGDPDATSGRGRDRRSGQIVRAEKLRDGARLVYSDGSREEIVNGQLQRFDKTGRIVEFRTARGSDIARFQTRLQSADAERTRAASNNSARVTKAIYRGSDIELHYSNGWRESIVSGQYRMTDPYSRLAIARRATTEDRARMERFRD